MEERSPTPALSGEEKGKRKGKGEGTWRTERKGMGREGLPLPPKNKRTRSASALDLTGGYAPRAHRIGLAIPTLSDVSPCVLILSMLIPKVQNILLQAVLVFYMSTEHCDCCCSYC